MRRPVVLILCGGRSGEHEVSLVSAFSVQKALDSSRFESRLIGIDPDGRWVLPRPEILAQFADKPRELLLREEPQEILLQPGAKGSPLKLKLPSGQLQDLEFDVVMPILHGTNGEDGVTQGILEALQRPFVGSGVLGSAAGMDKEVSKILFQSVGLPVVPWVTVMKWDYADESEKWLQTIEQKFVYPVFVKPACQGSSVGVGKAKDRAGLHAALQEAFRYDTKVLVELGVAARELEVSVLGNHRPRASVVGEIEPHHEFYSYEAKYLDANGAGLHIPARDLSPALSQRIQQGAVAAFAALGLRGLARVDFFLDRKTDELYLNEVNTLPGFTSISMYPKLWEASGLKYRDLLTELVQFAQQDHVEKSQLKTSFSVRS